ncbi:TlpA family protein disulfide reductase [Carboxylicivirga linearis]|uniref:TlpA family protein disulfide reductase n=1 Tax=Carboxylicivirga linearis TaxID=1628157 RepID=A0ABS5JQ63_9BACT|nr:TlpA disulfide reductase family protein [Carboxylicivirga linearis]MBS2097011.1 TlpA family protein disulfide reductase [Carboxylicivirga linearis]
MNKASLIVSAILICAVQAIAQKNVVIKGKAPEYANYSLVLETMINPISSEMRDLHTIKVDKEGAFYEVIEINEITYASLDVGRFRGNIYLEPGQSYELILPPFQPRTDAERFNPFFIPEDVVIGIANKEAQALNRTIIEFDYAFQQLYDENAMSIFSRGNVKKANSIINELDSLYPANVGSYFYKYKEYAYAELKTLAYKRQKRRVIEEVFTNNDVETNLPSFKTALNTVFKSFFTSYFSTSIGDSLKGAFTNQVGFDTLSTILQTDPLFTNPELAEVVLLKGLYDAFYTGRYNEVQIINLFNNAEKVGCSKEIKNLAKGLHKKVNWLRAGTRAPGFTLYRLDGKEKSLSDYEGHFVYLSFIHTENHACKQDLQLLNVIAKKMRRDVKLVTIILDEDPTNAEKMVKDNKYKWDFLHYGLMPKVVLDYDIKALPVYYIIDPEGKLRLSPSPSPGEDFAPVFQEVIRQYKYENLRRNRSKAKTIYDL